jgi:hypothetical protein
MAGANTISERDRMDEWMLRFCNVVRNQRILGATKEKITFAALYMPSAALL